MRPEDATKIQAPGDARGTFAPRDPAFVAWRPDAGAFIEMEAPRASVTNALSFQENLERVKGIEPSYSAWKAAALPLSYTR